MNMFETFNFQLQKSDIPKDLEQCRGVSHIVKSLYSWAGRCNKIGNLVSIFLMLIGLLAGTFAADASTDEVMAFATACLPWVIYGFIALLVTSFARVMILSVATIVYNTTVTANIALKNAYDDLSDEEKRALSAKENVKPTYQTYSKSASRLEDAIYDE